MLCLCCAALASWQAGGAPMWHPSTISAREGLSVTTACPGHSAPIAQMSLRMKKGRGEKGLEGGNEQRAAGAGRGGTPAEGLVEVACLPGLAYTGTTLIPDLWPQLTARLHRLSVEPDLNQQCAQDSRMPRKAKMRSATSRAKLPKQCMKHSICNCHTAMFAVKTREGHFIRWRLYAARSRLAASGLQKGSSQATAGRNHAMRLPAIASHRAALHVTVSCASNARRPPA